MGSFHLTLLGGGEALFEPLAIDPQHPEPLIDEVLLRLRAAQVRHLYYDLGDIALIDKVYYQWLNQLARACRAMAVELICINMQPVAAFALAGILEQRPAFSTALGVKRLMSEAITEREMANQVPGRARLR